MSEQHHSLAEYDEISDASPDSEETRLDVQDDSNSRHAHADAQTAEEADVEPAEESATETLTPPSEADIDAVLLRQIIEGLLLAAGRPLSVAALAELFGETNQPNTKQIHKTLKTIEADYEGRNFKL